MTKVVFLSGLQATLMIRRTKAEVANQLPDKTRLVVINEDGVQDDDSWRSADGTAFAPSAQAGSVF